MPGCISVFLLLLFFHGLPDARGEEARKILVSLKTGDSIQGDRIEYADGVFRVFRAGLADAISIPFDNVLKVSFPLEEENSGVDGTRKAVGTAGGVTSASSKGSSASPAGNAAAIASGSMTPEHASAPETMPHKPEPFALPQGFLRKRALDEKGFRLEEHLLDSSRLTPVELILGTVLKVNDHIEKGGLDAAMRHYRSLIRKEETASPADLKMRFLLCACLERSGEKEALQQEAKDLRQRHPEEKEVHQLLKDLEKGDFPPPKFRMRTFGRPKDRRFFEE